MLDILRIDPKDVPFIALSGVIAARPGNPARARQIAASLKAGQSDDRFERAHLLGQAQIAAAMGNHADAISLLRSIPHLAHPDDVQLFHSDPAFYAMRDDSQFRDFIRPRG